LGICIDRHELNAVHSFVDHPIDGITATTTNPDNLDPGK
jgi:hypothetical protein